MPIGDFVEMMEIVKEGMEHGYVKSLNPNVQDMYDQYMTMKELCEVKTDMTDIKSILQYMRKKVRIKKETQP
jgi:hypothetical protein